VNSGADPVFLCVPRLDQLCTTCLGPNDCAGGLCLSVDPRDTQTYCMQPCVEGSCREGFSCNAIEDEGEELGEYCLPTTGTCTCSDANAGMDRLCSNSNDHGRCFGREVCVPDEGWAGCDAAQPAAETCNGEDDDCNGLVDDLSQLGQACESEAELEGVTHRCAGAWICHPDAEEPVCSAPAPLPERCNLLDDDCDGAVDEDFPLLGELCEQGVGACRRFGSMVCDPDDDSQAVCNAQPGDGGPELCNYMDDDCDGDVDEEFSSPAGLRYTHVEHCGQCGRSCVGRFPNAQATCDGVLDPPECVVERCDPGFYRASATRCLPHEDPTCRACLDDAGCLMPGNRCLLLDGARVCGRDCGPANLYGTPAGWCPDGSVCADQPELGDGVRQCVPATSSCTCRSDAHAERTRACVRQGEQGVCAGRQACDPAQGWSPCDAPEPAAETCNGADDDCDGLADEDLVLPAEPCERDNEAGRCTGEWTCAGEGGWHCDAVDPLPETCNGRDDDCDGEIDEEFRDPQSGLYAADEHCGICNLSCADAVPFATESTCQIVAEQARCVPLACADGFELTAEPPLVCVPLGGASDCSPCVQDEHCDGLPDGRCVMDGGQGACARSCEANGDCPEGFDCQQRRCLPPSGTCSCQQADRGRSRLCFEANDAGLCFGSQVCEPDGAPGWGECDAPAAQAELCNGLDDDCDLAVDEDVVHPDGMLCRVDNELGTCEGVRICEGERGFVCTAREPEAERCDGVDNDCDGEADEDFRDPISGLYDHPEHCGVCGFGCAGQVDHAARMRCSTERGVATCIVDECEPGFFAVDDFSCVPVSSNRCLPCVSDRNCPVPGDRCLVLDGQQVCGQDCSEGNLHGTPEGTCPFGFECVPQDDGAQQCVPLSGSCTCLPEHAGATRWCSASSELGQCNGFESCDPERGWGGCTATAPVGEVCNGADDDCDGAIDEDFPDLGLPCTAGEGACLRNGVIACDGQGGASACSAAPGEPADERCDYQDNDCDGVVDEDFRDDASGLYVHDGHCGACNAVCDPGAVPFSVSVACELREAGVACVALECLPGHDLGANGRACVPRQGSFDCSPCSEDAHCEGLPGGRCEQFVDGRGCTRACEAAQDCQDGYNCVQGRCWPVSRSCECLVADRDQERPCFVGNEHGTCVGTQRCDPELTPGWSACDAGVPAPETCDGLDNDCNGLVDEGVEHPEGPECARANDEGRCVGRQVCLGAERWTCGAVQPEAERCDRVDNDCDGEVDEEFPGLDGPCYDGLGVCRRAGVVVCAEDGAAAVCTAEAGDPAPERCNGQDDDCDGEVDEDFMVDGAYAALEHCGVCGRSCVDSIDHATARCDASGDPPACVVETCADGYLPAGPRQCLPAGFGACEPCVVDAGCPFPGSECADLQGDGSFCLSPCRDAADCPPSSSCQQREGGLRCVPDTGSCTCDGSDLALTRVCEQQYAPGEGADPYTCLGRQQCTQAGWSECELPLEAVTDQLTPSCIRPRSRAT